MIVGDLYTGFCRFRHRRRVLVVRHFVCKNLSAAQQPFKTGLQGVVINSEVPRDARCGVAEKLRVASYISANPQRQDLNGRDFYDLAAQLTGRQRFMIETGNMRY